MKTSALVLAGLLSAGAVAGGTVAVMRQPTAPSPQIVSSPTVPQEVEQSQESIAPNQTKPSASIEPTRPEKASPPAPKTSSETVREVKRCKVLMAIVKDDDPPLNVRAQPNTDAAIVGTLEEGMFVSVKQERDGWFEIAEPAGWIAKNKTASRCGQKVEQVEFGTGKSGAELSDEFLGTGSHQYKMKLDKGQKLTVKGEVGPMPAVIGPDGKYLVGMEDKPDAWSTELPSSGEYTLELDSNYRGYKYDFSVEVK